ncbi:MAG TPA: M1 family aminopeptidase [Pyrinomonadaceae bacterium]|nr:M1 family aminopeptidase [Pyrinomonadaceae bacterium]
MRIVLALLFLILTGAPCHAQSTPVRYDLNVNVIPDAHLLQVSGTMTLPSSAASRTFIQLSLSELMNDFKVEVVQPNTSAGPARLEKSKVATWEVYPRNPFPSGEEIELRFSHSGGKKLTVLFYIGPEVSFASAFGTNWYPILVDGFDKGVGSLKITVPLGETAVAAGDRRSSSEQEAQGTFLFHINRATYFSFASGKFTTVRRPGRIPVSVHLLRERPNMQQYLERVAQLLHVLEREFGPYRFKDFALVEIPRDLAKKAGMNAATLQGFAYVNSNAFNVPPSRFDALVGWYGHEFSHSWWPHTVSISREGTGGWATEEALAEYGGLRAVETIVGAEIAEVYRRKGYPPDPIYSALEYFKLVGAGVDYELGHLPRSVEGHNIGYNKGFLVWNMLSLEIGREKFQRILHELTRRYAFQHVTLKDFWAAIEKRAGRNLGWFYKQWFERLGAPEFQLEWKQSGGKVMGAITQVAPYYRATMEVEVVGTEAVGAEKQRVVFKLRVNGARTPFTFPVKFRVQSVTLDPHYQVLRWTPGYHAAAEAARKAMSK